MISYKEFRDHGFDHEDAYRLARLELEENQNNFDTSAAVSIIALLRQALVWCSCSRSDLSKSCEITEEDWRKLAQETIPIADTFIARHLQKRKYGQI